MDFKTCSHVSGISESGQQDYYLVLSVVDTGIGIKEEDQQRLFQLFGFIEDNKQRNTHGIGLGLVISDQIVQRFDGKVSMSSKYGQGSTFKCCVKLN